MIFTGYRDRLFCFFVSPTRWNDTIYKTILLINVKTFGLHPKKLYICTLLKINGLCKLELSY